MSTSLARTPALLDGTNGREAPAPSQPIPGNWTPQASLTCCKDFAEASLPVSHVSNHHSCHGDGQVCHVGVYSDPGAARPRVVTYNLAVRVGNQSNGVPLATIVEQGSRSTLNSHSSLLAAGRHPSIRLVDTALPKHSVQRASQSLDEPVLEQIPEDLHPEQVVLGNPDEDRPKHSRAGTWGETDLVPDPIPPIKSTSHNNQHPDLISQLQDGEHEVDGGGLKGFFRGVLHNVRGHSRSRSRSSSVANAPAVEARAQRADAGDISPRALHGGDSCRDDPTKAYGVSISAPTDNTTSNLLHASRETPKPRTRSRKSFMGEVELSARVCSPSLTLPLLAFTPDSTQLVPVPHLLATPISSPSKEQTAPAHAIPSEPCDVAQELNHSAPTTLSHQIRNNISARHTFDGVPVHRSTAPSLRQNDCARDASRNASMCSTLSTSYSGPVLGVDLDLLQDFPHLKPRSPTPVWFTVPNMETDRVGASVPERQQLAPKETTSHSIQSSALPVLLPIAAASGIVQPNYTTPHISFYSPSGNLIQSEDSSTPGSTVSQYQGTIMAKTSYYNNPGGTSAQKALSAAMGLPPARPAPAPLTTPPNSTSPLPAHLKYHHNYQHAKKPHIVPQKSLVTGGPIVKGCGGLVKTNSLTLRSGLHTSPPHSKRKRRIPRFAPKARDLSHRPTYEATTQSNPRFYPCSRSRSHSQFRTLASCTAARIGKSSTPRKGNRLQKRHVAHASSSASASRCGRAHRSPNIGPLAGHALRVCFCQPYDGVGARTSAIACTGAGSKAPSPLPLPPGEADRPCESDASEGAAAGRGTPNARLVQGGHQHQQRKKHGRSRSDSGVSVGMRYAFVGR